MVAGPARIARLVGVYDADHTLRGELTYWIGARLGRAHCSLCDITHGTFRERRDWQECRSALPIRFDAFHRDDQPPAVRAATGNAAPVVVAETTDEIVVLLGPADLEACAGSPATLVDRLEAAAGARGLAWTA